jgi:hypothetical protein
MIQKIFYSSLNINAIKSIISETILENNGVNIDNKYDSIINETMKYIVSNINSIPPKGMSNEEYLFLMNKKVYNISVSAIKEDLKLKINKNQNIIRNGMEITKEAIISEKKNNNNSNNTNIFDPILLKNYENLPIMDYPKPGIDNNFEIAQKKTDVESRMKTFENERDNLIPKIKSVDFTIKNEELDTKNTLNLYNDLMSTYSTGPKKSSQDTGIPDFPKVTGTRHKQIIPHPTNNQENKKNEVYDIPNMNNLFNISPIDYVEMKDSIKQNNISSNYGELDRTITYLKSEDNSDTDSQDLIGFAKKLNSIEYFEDKKKDETLNNSEQNNSQIDTVPYNFNAEYNFSNNHLSQNETYKLEYSSTNSNLDVIVKEPAFDLIEESYYFIFDSKDRDLYIYPNPVSFQIKFNPNGNNFIYKSYYDKYGTLLIRERTISYGETAELNIQQKFDNISSINATNINIPTSTIQIGGSRPSNYPNSGSVPTNIFREPYVYLDVPELRGPYTGGNKLAYNSFAKLLVQLGGNSYGSQLNNNFVGIGTADANEFFKYNPVIHGKIDKMTLNLLNKNGYLFNFGIDKLYIDNFSSGIQIFNGFCGIPFFSTIINIQIKNIEYARYCNLYFQNNTDCTTLNSHPIQTGDLLYFYNTRPNCNDIIYLESNIKVSNITPTTIGTTQYLSMTFTYLLTLPNGTVENINVDFYNILSSQIERSVEFENEVMNYYIILFNTETRKEQFFSIYKIYNDYVLVNYISSYPTTFDNLKVGIAKKNLRGSNSTDPQSLFFNGGYYVSNATYQETDTSIFYFNLAYPYSNILSTIYDYYPGEIFFIQDKMQLSYTFLIKCMIKDYKKLKSLINDSGNS